MQFIYRFHELNTSHCTMSLRIINRCNWCLEEDRMWHKFKAEFVVIVAVVIVVVIVVGVVTMLEYTESEN
jgi:hypothetical protein